jgi:threonine dehydrogenase-like Zn-dependent dehydrogenase
MRAMAVTPGRPGTATIVERDEPAGTGDVVVEGLAVGICGTDVEIAEGAYGEAPPGEDVLVLGHESLGRVLSAPPTSGLAPGDLVVGIVRRPDPEPCPACAVGEWDMCQNGRYTERGIKQLHGFGAERWRIEAPFAVRIDPTLGLAGVLVEPASVVAKAWDHITQISGRSPTVPRRALVTGAGPIGLLAALLAVQRGLEVHVLDRVDTGPKPDLVRALGATYHTGSVTDVPQPDVVIECTGAASVVLDVLQHNGPTGIVCLTGVSGAVGTTPVDLAALNTRLVLENDVIFGSVNANRRHYESAAAALVAADIDWLSRLITARVPLSSWTDGLHRGADDVKVVVDLTR